MARTTLAGARRRGERVENVSSLTKCVFCVYLVTRQNKLTDPPPDALQGLSLETVDLSHNRLTSLGGLRGS